MFPACSMCGAPTRPATNEERAVFGSVSAMPGLMTWKCTKCEGSFVRPLERHQVEAVERYLSASTKRWWQFWK